MQTQPSAETSFGVTLVESNASPTHAFQFVKPFMQSVEMALPVPDMRLILDLGIVTSTSPIFPLIGTLP